MRTDKVIELAVKAISKRQDEIDTQPSLTVVIVTVNIDRHTRKPLDAVCNVTTREVAES